ncbi:glycosyltransferase [Xanthomarina sp. F2636L]|uniref:glycosyltransferase n=1 Tax=Xanthomarina sp. F2636L TaxID=2996018 RepID=UPI00225E0ED9|nr:glycosyltransferase [Xanthomarina sp. F2636L]MCX7549364.1 glycosyltransferase [Xanthomarina sp. F2636L]
MKIAILTPNKSTATETFIKNHIDFLPFEKIVVFGDKLPYLTHKDKPSLISRLYIKYVNVLRKILGKKPKSLKAFQLKKLLKSHEVDLVFAEYLITGAEVLDVCKDLKMPIIPIALGYDISLYSVLEKYQEKYKQLFQYASSVIVVSKHMKTNLLALNCPESKIIYSPAGPDSSFFELQPKLESKQVLAVGRFVEKKAPHLTILAFKEVLNKFPDATLVMAGDGVLLNVCKDLVRALKINNSVRFLGVINQEQQRELLEESLIFVQHSVIAKNGDSEGTPVAILEAMATGIPVVSTEHAGIPDIIEHDKTGLLVPEHNIQLMAEMISSLLSNNIRAKELGMHARLHVKQHFTLKTHIDTIAKVVNKSAKAK